MRLSEDGDGVHRFEQCLGQMEALLASGDVEGARELVAEQRRRLHSELSEEHLPDWERLRKFERLFEITNSLPAIAGFDGHFKEIGPRWTQLLGFSEDELKSRPFVEFVHEEDVASTNAAAAQLACGTDVVSFENRYRCADGTYVVLRWFSSMDVEAELVYAVAIDVTEEYVARRRVQRSERLLLETGALAKVGGWEYDLDTDRLTWMPEVFKIHEIDEGLSEPDLDAALAFYPGEAADEIRRAVQHSVEYGIEYDLVLPFVTARGQQRWVRAMGKPTLSSAGEIVGLHGAFQDVTHSKLREEELERTREEALEASRFKSQFLANMSHEIRTPLNGMIGTLQLTADLDLEDEARELVDVAQHSAENLLLIVNDLLDLAKIESGHMQLESVSFQPREAMGELVRAFQGAATAKGLSLTGEVDERVARAYVGDPTRVRQVLSNLVSNAIKFTERGRVVVSLKLTGAGKLRFDVTDTGPGVPRDGQAEIFEAFRQADGTITRRFGGTGLGLTICRELVSLMDGQIDVRSKPGHGSTFFFVLPLLEDTTPMAGRERRGSAEFSVQGLEILLAEDNDINAMVAQRTLTKMGHTVTRVLDGAQAVEWILEKTFDLVLMDVQMPNLDGLQATRLVRGMEESHRWRRVPIVALTANAFESDVRRCLAAGMDEHLAKPLRRNALQEVIERYGAVPRTPAA